MSSAVMDILQRMKDQKRSGPPIKISPRRSGMGTAYSTRVSPVKTPEVAPKAGTKENISSGCGTRKVKGGEGARGMDTKDIEKFITEKAPREIKNKLARMQKKPRLELCKLLAQFPAGRKLVYSESNGKKPKSSTPPSPESASNLNAMYAQMNYELKKMASQQEKKEQKLIKKIINRKNLPGTLKFNISPVSTPGNTPNSNSNNENNYMNYGNNGNNENRNFRAKGLQEAYMMRLASKRVEKDPLEQTLTKYQRKQFAPRSLKRTSPKKSPVPRRSSPGSRPLRNKIMSFGPNTRIQTVTKAPTISTRTKLSTAKLRSARNTVKKRMDTLRSTLRNLRNKKKPTKLQKARIRVLTKLVNTNANATQSRFLNQEIGKTAVLINLGAISPPRVRSPPKKSFSLMRPIIEGTPEKLKQMMKKKVPPSKPINTNAIVRAREQYEVTMRFLINGKPCIEYSKKKLVSMAKVFFPRNEDLEKLTKVELCKKLRPKMQKIMSS